MKLHLRKVEIRNFRIIKNTVITLNEGVNAFVGENNSGKTATVDAIRLCLGTRSYEMNGYIEEGDFNDKDKKIEIQCCFSDLTEDSISSFLKYLTYENGKATLYINFTAEKTKGRIIPKRSTGKNYDGDPVEQELLDYIVCTYLKPLRDAETELSAKKYSRISKILESKLNLKQSPSTEELECLQKEIRESVNKVLNKNENQDKFQEIENAINEKYFSEFLLNYTNTLQGKLSLSSSLDIRSILEKFELSVNQDSRQGLGINNILFMAAEMLLLEEYCGILLIEEPEAHLHPQLQLSFTQALEEIAKTKKIQIILSTHSVTLASKIPVEQLTLITNGKAFSLAQGQTKLKEKDYKFLSKFLDATKANLFFARGVLVVEGDAENILLPSIARIMNKDLTKYGVSIVKMGHKDSDSPYINIFKRKEGEAVPIKVCSIGDTDDYDAKSSESINEGIKETKLNKTFEYYLMEESTVLKEKILAICKELKPNTNEIQALTVTSNSKEIYEICFENKKTSKTEVALRLAIAIDENEVSVEEVKKATNIVNSIMFVTENVSN